MKRLGTCGWLALLALLLIGCEATDMGTATTQEADFTIEVTARNRFVNVGDQLPIVVRLWRTDQSNLDEGSLGEILLTSSVQGGFAQGVIPIQISDAATTQFAQAVVFTARQSGVAEIRATFLDATARAEIIISSTDF